MSGAVPALVVVDMQRYYLREGSPYVRYFNALQPGCLEQIIDRCETTVIPNIARLLASFRDRRLPVVFLRLCGTDPGRRDLHRFFRETYERGMHAGFDGVYPLAGEPWADIIDELAPLPTEPVVDKTTFSPFTSTGIDGLLGRLGATCLVLTGLATSQCVETTARDASDRGYGIVHIEDAQADYDGVTHASSLLSSRGVCGGDIETTDGYLASRP